MSTLHTLHDAFVELERQADELPARADPASDLRSARRARLRHTRVMVAGVLGAAVIVIVAVGGLLRVTGGSGDGGLQPAAPTVSHPTTLWMAKDVPCPPHPAKTGATGAVMRFDSSTCVRLATSLATFRSLDAKAVPGAGGQWYVQVRLDERQSAKFARASKVATGHILAVVDSGEVLSAPQVQATLKGGNLQIAAGSKKQADHIAHLLRTP